MIYQYEILEGIDVGCVIEIDQKMSDPRLTVIAHEGQEVAVRRVITGGTGFILKGGCWHRDGYEYGIQSPEKAVKELKQGK